MLMKKGKVFKFQIGKWWYQQTMTSYVYTIPRATTTIHTHTQTHTHKEIHSKTLSINKDGILKSFQQFTGNRKKRNRMQRKQTKNYKIKGNFLDSVCLHLLPNFRKFQSLFLEYIFSLVLFVSFKNSDAKNFRPFVMIPQIPEAFCLRLFSLTLDYFESLLFN